MASGIRCKLFLQIIAISSAQSTDCHPRFSVRSRVEAVAPIHTEQITGNKTVVEITPEEHFDFHPGAFQFIGPQIAKHLFNFGDSGELVLTVPQPRDAVDFNSWFRVSLLQNRVGEQIDEILLTFLWIEMRVNECNPVRMAACLKINAARSAFEQPAVKWLEQHAASKPAAFIFIAWIKAGLKVTEIISFV